MVVGVALEVAQRKMPRRNVATHHKACSGLFFCFLCNAISTLIFERQTARPCSDTNSFWRRLVIAGKQVLIDPWRARSDRIEILLREGIEDIAQITDGNFQWLPRREERIAARLQHLPKRCIPILAVARQILVGHAEGKGLKLNFVLAAFECFVEESVNFAHFIVRHGVTADRSAAAMYHNQASGTMQ